MFTTIDKALIALVMGLLYAANYFFGLDFGVSEAQVAAIISVLTPILVYLVPNKQT